VRRGGETPVIRTRRLVARLAEQEDVPAIVDYYDRNRDHLAPWEPLRPAGFYTELFWATQVDRNIRDAAGHVALRLFAFDREDPSRVVACINYSNFVHGVAYFCTLGYSADAASQGRGYMTEALHATNRHVFDERAMHRIMANYMPRNERSGRLLRRLGFQVEGYARDYLMIAGRWEDHILTSLVNPDWRPLAE
jgi:ribosomal-protein-alanine N-acetyltransferase